MRNLNPGEASVRVMLWGKEVGQLQFDQSTGHVFTYSQEWFDSGIQPSPLLMPLGRKHGYSFPELNPQTYHGVPGMIADALPDRFGNAVIDACMIANGHAPHSVTPLQRLAYLGQRAMGALEFESSVVASDTNHRHPDPLVVSDMVESARRVIAGSMVNIQDPLLVIGSSAGGARAKAVIGYNPQTVAIISDHSDLPSGYQSYLIKLDGVEGQPGIYGRREMAHLDMAAASGISVPDHFLLEENGRAHLLVRRFDRLPDGQKIHMQTLCGLAHLDYNQRMTTDYSAWLRIIRDMGLGQSALEDAFRRMVFNVAVVNCDDHTKNQSFLMNQEGAWSLSPSYDLAYAWSPVPSHWTHQHQMTVNGKAWNITRADLHAVGAAVNIKFDAADDLIDQVLKAVRRWQEFADRAGLNEQDTLMISERQKSVSLYL